MVAAMVGVLRWEVLLSAAGLFAAMAALLASFLVRWAPDKVLVPQDSLPQTTTKRAVQRWQFPPKEDKHARRTRWARVMAKGLRQAMAANRKVTAVVKPRETSAEQVLSFFLAADRRHCLPLLRKLPGSPMRGQLEAEQQQLAAMAASSPMLPAEANRIKARILRVLIDAGPAKALCPIVEVLGEGEGEREGGGGGGRKGGGMVGWGMRVWGKGGGGLSLPSVPDVAIDLEAGIVGGFGVEERVGEEEGEGREEVGGSQYDMDLDPVVAVGGVGISREMLWGALARLGGEAYRQEVEAEVRGKWHSVSGEVL